MKIIKLKDTHQCSTHPSSEFLKKEQLRAIHHYLDLMPGGFL